MATDILEWSLQRHVENAGRRKILLFVPENLIKTDRASVWRVVRNARVVRHKRHYMPGLMWACWEGWATIGGAEVKVFGWALVPRDKVEWADSIPSEWQDDSGG